MCMNIYVHMYMYIYSHRPTLLWIMQKYWRAGPPEMPPGLRSWYVSGIKSFRPAILVGCKWRSQLSSVIKPVPHDLVRRIRSWRIKSPEQDVKYLHCLIINILFWNPFTGKGTQIIDWNGRLGYVREYIFLLSHLHFADLLSCKYMIQQTTTLNLQTFHSNMHSVPRHVQSTG